MGSNQEKMWQQMREVFDQAVCVSDESASLEWNGENEYTLKFPEPHVYITVDEVTVMVKREGDGASVYLFDKGKEDEDCTDSAYHMGPNEG